MILRIGTRNNYRIRFLPTSGTSSCGISTDNEVILMWMYMPTVQTDLKIIASAFNHSRLAGTIKLPIYLSSLGISQGKIISVNLLLCYR